MTIANAARETKDIPVGLIDEPELPSRTAMDEQKLDELAASIKAIGVQQPIVVVRQGERFRVIAGHRRRVAAGRVGLVVMPCIVYAEGTEDLDVVQFAENYHREELNPADEAIWFSELLERKCAGDITKLCALLGITRSYADGRLLLFSGCREVFEALRAESITIGVAHELNRITDPEYRHYYLVLCVRDGATIATAQGYVQQWKHLFVDVPKSALPETAAAPSVAVMPAHDPMQCYVCRKVDREIPQFLYVHQSCLSRILDPMLAHARGEGT